MCQGTGFTQGKFQTHPWQHQEAEATPKAPSLATGISEHYVPVENWQTPYVQMGLAIQMLRWYLEINYMSIYASRGKIYVNLSICLSGYLFTSLGFTSMVQNLNSQSGCHRKKYHHIAWQVFPPKPSLLTMNMPPDCSCYRLRKSGIQPHVHEIFITKLSKLMYFK